MAFPTGYTLYQNVTIDNTQVDATLTDYPCFVDLSDMLKAGDDVFDTCRTDGGDIRITLTDGTTQLAREIVSIDTTAKTGEMHVKIPSLASGTDTVVRVWYNGIDTEPAEDSTYGSENTWNSNYKMVQHMDDTTTSSITDSTANDNNGVKLAANEPAEITGKIGKGQDFDRTDDEISVANSAELFGMAELTLSSWVKFDGSTTNEEYNIYGAWVGGDTNYLLRYDAGSGDDDVGFFIDTSSGTSGGAFVSTDLSDSNYHLIHATYDGSTMLVYKDASGSATTGSNTGSIDAGSTVVMIGGMFDSSADNWDGVLDECRILATALPATWISTEYNNQSSPSTFYAVGDEQGGTPAGRPLPQRVLSGPFVGPLGGPF